MISAATFRELVSGRRRGLAASLLRGLLAAVEPFYTAAVRWRNRRYDRRGGVQIGVPVISVGNLTLGGTGKTPMVRWVVRLLRDQDVRPAIVSRGYGASDGAENDEARELGWLLPDVTRLQNPDRVAAAQEAVRQYHSQAIVLDDGFQHRRIARDVDIVLIDALEPFGFGHVFPRGTLREPLEGLRRANAVVLTRANLIEPSEREQIWQTVRQYAPTAITAEAAHVAQSLLSANGSEIPLDEIRGKDVIAFCGIGNPTGFRRMVDSLGCRVVAFHEFPDHYPYQATDIDGLLRQATELGAAAVLCTCKDLVKWPVERTHRRPIWAIRIDLEFLSGQSALESLLVEHL